MDNKILIIEDDRAISEMVQNFLAKEGFNVESAFDGEEGISKFFKEDFNMVILDLMMPKLDGMETLKIIREKSLVPVLIMSAKDSDIDKALGLGFGADDYIVKPFSVIELSARVKACIRRATKYVRDTKKQEDAAIKIHNLTVDIHNFSVIKNGEHLQLTAKEFDILKLFIKNPGRVFTKAEIYSFVWQDEYYGDENIINVHMRRLREKIEENPSHPNIIKTLWGIGYKLEATE